MPNKPKNNSTRRLDLAEMRDAAEAARIGLAATRDFDEALAAALACQEGRASAGERVSIGVVTHGADIVGRIKES